MRWPRRSGRTSPGFLHDLDYAPALLLGDGARLRDAHQVADLALVLLVVGLEADAVLQDLLVERMALQVLELDHDGLLHLVRDHAAHPDLAKGPRLRRLGRLHVGHSVSFSSSSAAAASPSAGSSATGRSATPVAAGAPPGTISRPCWGVTGMVRAMSFRTLWISPFFSS